MNEKAVENKETSAKRTLKILKLLKGKSLTGLSNNDIAQAIKESPANVTRACQALIEEGLVEKMPNGRFALSTGMLQIAVAHQREMVGGMDRINEINQRVNAGAY
jgi:DNA-binding IclR family transcriptional regulator